MQRKFMSSNAMHVDKIAFIDGKTITDCEIMFFDRFIIVSRGDASPDFYNIDSVDAMLGVRQIQAHARATSNYNYWNL